MNKMSEIDKQRLKTGAYAVVEDAFSYGVGILIMVLSAIGLVTCMGISGCSGPQLDASDAKIGGEVAVRYVDDNLEAEGDFTIGYGSINASEEIEYVHGDRLLTRTSVSLLGGMEIGVSLAFIFDPLSLTVCLDLNQNPVLCKVVPLTEEE